MKTTKHLSAKKLIALFIGFALLIATLTGILFGTKAARAEINDDVRSDTQIFAVNSPQKVTADGVEDNTYIIFNCDRPFSDIVTLKQMGYKYVTVFLIFEMREIYDGYQYIYLYSGVNGREVYCVELNYYGDNKIDVFHTVIVNYVSLPLDEFSPNNIMNLCLKFNADGRGYDDWMFQNMQVTVEVSKSIITPNTEIVDYRDYKK